MKNCRMIITDLDGTLLENDGLTVSQENTEALLLARRRGIICVAATGRGYDSMPEIIRSGEILDYAVTSNGAAVHDLHAGKVLFRNLMKAEAVRKHVHAAECFFNLPRYEEALTRRLDYEVFVDGRAYGQCDYLDCVDKRIANPHVIRYIRKTRRPVDDIHSFLEENIDKLDGLCFVMNDPRDKRALWEHLSGLSEDVQLTDSVGRLLELEDRSCTKWLSCERLCRLIGIDPGLTIAFGDGNNDLDMLLHAGVGVVMENADPSLKLADFTVTAKNSEGGLAKALYQLNII